MFNRKHERISYLTVRHDTDRKELMGLREQQRNHKAEIKSLRHQLDAAQEARNALQRRLTDARPAVDVLRTEADKLEKKANGTAIARGADAAKVATMRDTARVYRAAALAVQPSSFLDGFFRSSVWGDA